MLKLMVAIVVVEFVPAPFQRTVRFTAAEGKPILVRGNVCRASVFVSRAISISDAPR